MRVARAAVSGLFGYLNHEVEFSKQSPVTIIAGPNGLGKTHLLRLINALISLDVQTLASVNFESLEVTFDNKSRLSVKRLNDSKVELRGQLSPRHAIKALPLAVREKTEEQDPSWIIRLPGDILYDARFERNISAEQARIRYGIRVNDRYMLEGTWAEQIYDGLHSVLIDTKRLDTPPTDLRSAHYRTESTGRRSDHAPARIDLYMRHITALLSDARRTSLNATLKADQSFAFRALEKARTTIKEEQLKERYRRIADQHEELHASGLIVDAADIKFPEGSTNPTERRILNIYLNDWERRLQGLFPVHEKLKLLRAVIDGKFIGKELVITPKGILRFRTLANGHGVGVHSLSSGEQHLLAVFTMLLFATPENSLVMIDEPEISMHAAWKHELISDIADVARVSNLQVVLATHSSAVVSGQWDLVRELEIPAVAPTFEGEPASFDDSEIEE